VFVPRYSESAARQAIAASTNWSQALRRLGMRAAGGNHAVLKRWAAAWEITTEHFAPYAHVGTHLQRQLIPLERILVERSSYTRSSLKRRLYETGLKTRACELCGQGELWRGLRMSLILDHINGVHDDNRLENLRILCPNCAATLPTHCSRNLPMKVCPTCGEEFRKGGRRQRFCSQSCWQRSAECREARARAGRRKVERPSYEQLLADLAEMSWVAVGAKYGVSDNAVRKWMRRYEAARAAQRAGKLQCAA
jgi:Zn-finger nucleic acid-binding protein